MARRGQPRTGEAGSLMDALIGILEAIPTWAYVAAVGAGALLGVVGIIWEVRH